MKRLFTNYLSILLLLCAGMQLWAQAPAGYYNSIEGKADKELKTALSKIIKDHTQRTYKELWTDFKTTDKRADGKVWDMYSSATNYTFGGPEQGANYKKEGDSYNREHSFPKSWFNDAYPIYTDLFHLYPTDGWVNNKRGNYPFGETDRPTYTSIGGFCKLGPSGFTGYTGVVFEPDDEYKGDFARSYFYMVTCYEDKVTSWHSDMLAVPANTYPVFSDWAVNLLLKWSRQDAVSKKETDRNNAVYKLQKNRNPFIDYPQLVEYIWGDKKGQPFSFSALGIGSAEMNPVFVSVSDGKVKVETEDHVKVSVYNICGTLLTTGEGESEIYLPVNEKGVLLVKVQSNLHVITCKVRN